MMVTEQRLLVVGLMSGSSLDGLDLAACDFHLRIEKNEDDSPSASLLSWNLKTAETLPFSNDWKIRLRELPHQSALELALAHAHFGRYLGELTASFLERHHLSPDAIASHGHTIFHFPEHGMTFQLGDGAAISSAVSCPVIVDFRSTDIAWGGQGAPLAPLVDQYLFSEFDGCLNLGGIANLSWKVGNSYVAFDVTGANQLLNALAQKKGQAFDEDGKMAAAGKLNTDLLKELDAQAFFEKPYPKSLGNHWVQNELLKPCMAFQTTIENKLHTVCIHVARQIAAHIRQIIQRESLSKSQYRLLATGGGANNSFLMNCIEHEVAQVGNITLEKPNEQLVGFKEAALMALMGALRLAEVPNCLASATGAKRNAVGGAIYWGG